MRNDPRALRNPLQWAAVPRIRRRATSCSASITVLPVTRMFSSAKPSARSVRRAAFRRSEVQCRHLITPRGDELFRERMLQITVRSPARYARTECRDRTRQTRGKDRRRITLGENPIGWTSAAVPSKRFQQPRGQPRQRLIRLHQQTIMVGVQIEQPKHLIEHLAMLTVEQTTDRISSGRRDRSRITGAVLIASGRVRQR